MKTFKSKDAACYAAYKLSMESLVPVKVGVFPSRPGGFHLEINPVWLSDCYSLYYLGRELPLPSCGIAFTR